MIKERLFTAKELAFIAAYQGYGAGAQAAIDAGYSPKYAKQRSCKLVKKPAIKKAIEEKQRQIIGESVRLRAAGIVSEMSA
jgi:phage terminase small subunit